MEYSWRCVACRRTVEVFRTSMRDYATPPETPCRCGKADARWVRGVELPSRLARDSGREGHIWPMKNPHLRDEHGNVPTFQSESQYAEWLDKRGLVRICEGDDPSVNRDSQHSAYDRFDPPPSPEAAEMLAGAQFLDHNPDLPSEAAP